MAGLSPADFFAAALELVGERGAEGLTLATLCERVGVTKGSFYHHFDSMASLHEGMLAHWEAAQIGQARGALAATEPRARLAVLRGLAVAAQHETEVAVRAWATWYEPAAEAYRRVQDGRQRTLVHTFRQLGIDEAHAATLARVGRALMAGVQSEVGNVDRTVMDEVLTEYQRWIEASAPHA
jgi:AcrR family transcriptional regulator